MARYIDLDKVEFLKTEDNKEFNHGVDCCINKLLDFEPVDVIERSEYEALKKENHELAIKYDNAMNRVTDGMEEISRLRSKIDKAKKQITDSMNEHLASDGTPIDEYAYCYLNALEILEENIGE